MDTHNYTKGFLAIISVSNQNPDFTVEVLLAGLPSEGGMFVLEQLC
jgi:hypothetical protein